jgi:hypothetical protein
MSRPDLPDRPFMHDLLLPQTTSPHHARVVKMVKTSGFGIMHIGPDPAAGRPRFTYTVGLTYTWGVPEAVMFGLEADVAHASMHQYRTWIVQQPRLVTPATSTEIFTATARLVDVHPSWKDYCQFTSWFYGPRSWRMVQIVWPDTHGRFSDEPGYETQFRAVQPDCRQPLVDPRMMS